ncbi:MAG: CRTAC1 family protein [Acidobacteria bacterium]|nr:CRTAC1 family protein [Acidobacteriota bacterium]
MSENCVHAIFLKSSIALSALLVVSLAMFVPTFVSSYPAGPGDFPPSFVDVTSQAGIDFTCTVDERLSDIGCGATTADFNNDGFQDIFLPQYLGPNALYLNNGDGTFTDMAFVAGVALPDSRSQGACAADYDNDGWIDLYVTGMGQNHLFRNLVRGLFREVTSFAGADGEGLRGSGCAWGDYDGDGFVDLVVTNWISEPNEAVGRALLYHNQGNGTFEEVGLSLLGPATTGAGFQPVFVDYNNDGRPDIYLVNDFGMFFQPNTLFRNEGPGPDGRWRFTDVSQETGTNLAIHGMGIAIGDYDRNGLLDFYVTNMGSNFLLQQRSDHTFASMAGPAGVQRTRLEGFVQVGWGAFFFDYDNDGWLDLYVVDGFLLALVTNSFTQPNGLYRNNQDGTFTDLSDLSGLGDRGRGRGGIYLDIENDGLLDVLVANVDQPAILYRNVGQGGNWLRLRLQGSQSNRDGIGAQIRVVTRGQSQLAEMMSGTSHMGGQGPFVQFGLGSARVADLLEIRWPSGAVQRFHNVPVNQILTIPEAGKQGRGNLR